MSVLLTSGILGILPDITINDNHIAFIKLLPGLIAGAGVLMGVGAGIWSWIRFRRGDDSNTVEVLGVAHEEDGVDARGDQCYKVTSQVWGHHESAHDMVGRANKKLGDRLVAAIRGANPVTHVASIKNDKMRRWTLGRLDGRIDGNDWQGNADRVKRRKTHEDRFGCCLFGVGDPDGMFGGVIIVFDDASAGIYASSTFVDRCHAVDDWSSHVPQLLHNAAVQWLKRKETGSTAVAWTATVSSRDVLSQMADLLGLHSAGELRLLVAQVKHRHVA